MSAPVLRSPDRVHRRVMFGVEFIDPVTRRIVSERLKVRATGLGEPLRSPTGRFVWFDQDPPAARPVTVTAEALDGKFTADPLAFVAPAHDPDLPPPPDLLRTVELRPTGLYDPPEGMIAVSGMLVTTHGSADPVDGIEVSIELRHGGGSVFTSSYVAVTDARGGFVAVINDLGGTIPDLPEPPTVEGALTGWLRFFDGTGHFTGLLPLRRGRRVYLAEPVEWDALAGVQP
jgi:hypothetical protein